MQLGPYTLENRLILAPMAGVTDRPFRLLCRKLGAGMAIAEMMSANPALRDTEKSLLRADHTGESGIRAIQIAGADPVWMADAAQYNAERGAQLIDINMGCPAKKVCNKYAGSALMADLELAEKIIQAVVNAVRVPVTVKMRSGVSANSRNAIELALRAQEAGVTAITVHGRTRDQLYKGQAEYDSVRSVKQALSIPVIANGDIDTPQKAADVLQTTGCDALMIGRAAHGNPWIFREINHFLTCGSTMAAPTLHEVAIVMLEHVRELQAFYGTYKGVRIARKHVGWYLQESESGRLFSDVFNQIESADEQLQALHHYFAQQDFEQQQVDSSFLPELFTRQSYLNQACFLDSPFNKTFPSNTSAAIAA